MIRAIAAGGYILAAYLFVGTLEFNDKLAAAAEKKSTMEPARIWSKRCAKSGLMVYATQADGGKWVIKCVNKKGSRA